MSKKNNLKDFLTDLYEGISSKKPGASRNPQNFRSEIESIQTGVDTSDATASSAQILNGYTAYANDQKITGSIANYNNETIGGTPAPDTFKRILDSGKSCYYMFAYCSDNNLANVIDYDVTENVTNFSYMFYASSLTNLPLFNTKSGTNFSYMYYRCTNATSFPLIDTSSGTTFSNMYYYCTNATSFPLIDTSKGASFSNMYYYCTKATSFPTIDTSSGSTFSSMYSYCSSATSFPSINTGNGVDFSYMYSYCSMATSFPSINTEKGTNFSYMYGSCSSATSFPSLNTTNGTNFASMYYGALTGKSFPALNTSKGTNLSSMYYNCTSVETLPEIDTSLNTNFNYIHYCCYKLKNRPKMNTSKATSFQQAFYSCYVLPKIDISYFNISSTSYTNNMCYNCYSLKAFIIRQIGGSYILNTNAFTNCYHLTGTTNSTYNPTGAKDGYIYVPRTTISTLKSASGWSTYASQIRALEDYTVDGTLTGAFDDAKAGL